MPCSKAGTIYNWKRKGVIYDNYDELYEVYIKTMQCGHCKTEFTKNNCRCLDHDHTTGLFRKIVCNRCNSMDSYIRFPNGFTEQDRKEQIKEYRQANKDKIKEQKKEYRQANKDKIKEQKKEYYQANKQKISEQNKEHYQANKQKISERDKQKIECECGSIVRRSDIAKHKRSKKHSNYKLNNFV